MPRVALDDFRSMSYHLLDYYRDQQGVWVGIGFMDAIKPYEADVPSEWS